METLPDWNMRRKCGYVEDNLEDEKLIRIEMKRTVSMRRVWMSLVSIYTPHTPTFEQWMYIEILKFKYHFSGLFS